MNERVPRWLPPAQDDHPINMDRRTRVHIDIRGLTGRIKKVESISHVITEDTRAVGLDWSISVINAQS